MTTIALIVSFFALLASVAACTLVGLFIRDVRQVLQQPRGQAQVGNHDNHDPYARLRPQQPTQPPPPPGYDKVRGRGGEWR